MPFYHFTSLLNLPAIMRDGITQGECPLLHLKQSAEDYSSGPKAVNLTTNGNYRDQLRLWAGATYPTSKVRVRLSVDVPSDELVTFSDLVQRYGMPENLVEKLGKPSDLKPWFFVFGVLRPEQISSVEVLDIRSGKYDRLKPWQIQSLIERIETETQRALIIHVEEEEGPDKGNTFISCKPGGSDTWLFDAESVAEGVTG